MFIFINEPSTNNFQFDLKKNIFDCFLQLHARERELQLMQEEKQKREELERQLNEEIHLREKIAEENIKLRDKKQTQVNLNSFDSIKPPRSFSNDH